MWIIFEQHDPEILNQFKCSLNWMKLGMLSSFHQQCMWWNLKLVMIITNGSSCTKLDHSLRSIGVSTGNNHIANTTYYFLNDLNPKHSLCWPLSIHSNILKFQTIVNLFAKYYAFSDIFLSKIPMKLKVD